jgi:protein arginine N-methyltransferase 2
MEGVRMEMLQAILRAQGGSESDEEEEEEDSEAMQAEEAGSEKAAAPKDADGEVPVSTASDNKAFLKSRLRFETDEHGDERCIDEEGNGVMMGWENPIMQETARLLCEGHQGMEAEGEERDYAVLNVGFGLGLIDTELQRYKPTRHVIIEPHPDVLAHARSKGWYDKPGVEFFAGTWREYIAAFYAGDQLAEFDAIYVSVFLVTRLYRPSHNCLTTRSLCSSILSPSTTQIYTPSSKSSRILSAMKHPASPSSTV